jgi:hypothetical protein
MIQISHKTSTVCPTLILKTLKPSELYTCCNSVVLVWHVQYCAIIEIWILQWRSQVLNLGEGAIFLWHFCYIFMANIKSHFSVRQLVRLKKYFCKTSRWSRVRILANQRSGRVVRIEIHFDVFSQLYLSLFFMKLVEIL